MPTSQRRQNDKIGVRRIITGDVVKFIENKQVVSLTGIRRSGKSTIMYQVMDHLVKGGLDPRDILYVNFEDPYFANNNDLKTLDAVFQTYRENVNPDHRPYLFLDEIQNIDQWEKWVRTKNELNEAKIFVTGPSAKLLSSDVSTKNWSHFLPGTDLFVAVPSTDLGADLGIFDPAECYGHVMSGVASKNPADTAESITTIFLALSSAAILPKTWLVLVSSYI